MDAARDILDRTVTSYTGGINTDEYYAKIYANEQNGVPTETLVIQGQQQSAVVPAGQQPAAAQPVQQDQYTQNYQQNYPTTGQQPLPQGAPQGANESPIDYFLRTSGTGTDATVSTRAPVVQQPATIPTTQTVPASTQTTPATSLTTSVGTAPSVTVSPTGVFGFVVQAAFSVAVVVSVIGLMFIVYIIIRTRQLHHHEDHVKELGGHGGGHGDTHAPAVVHDVAHAAPDVHSAIHDAHTADTHMGGHVELHHDEPLIENGVETHAHDAVDTHPHDHVLAVHEDDIVEEPQKPVESMTTDESNMFSSRLATIRSDAQSDDEDAWYTALMDINLLLEDILTEKNFEGATVKEMLGSDAASGMATRDLALEAEAQFQKLISGEEQLTQDAITRLVNMYAKVCKELGVV